MAYGGTNWGNLGEPSIYTSYDYGASIREDRSLSSKYFEVKLQAGFLHASTEFLIATRIGNGTIGDGTPFSDNDKVYTTALASPNGAHFYIVRQTSVNNLTPTQFTLRVNTTEGQITVPQFGSSATLDGRESQIIVSEYPYGSHKLKYSTAEIFTWTTIDNIDYLVLYAERGHGIEVVISGVGSSVPSVSGSTTISAMAGVNDTAVITGSPSGISTVTIGKTIVVVADKHSALSFWNIRIPGSGHTLYDRAPDVPSVLVIGPYLVRAATLEKSQLALRGDLNATTTLDVIAPSSVNHITWNDAPVKVKRTDIGTLRGTLPFSVQTPTLPKLKEASWFCIDSLPELQPGFDDSQWVSMNKTSTPRPFQPLGGKFVLYTDEYGFHQGNTISRGHFTGKSATGVQLIVQGGSNFGYSAWINSRFLGSNQGHNGFTPGGDLTNDTWTFNPDDLNDGDNVVTVVLDPTGIDEDFDSQDTFKNPRGVRGYQLLGEVDFDHWKVQGNLGGEDFPDKVRGPLNEGGLFVERQGDHLPGAPFIGWHKSTLNSTCTPYTGLTSAGIKAYRTTFDLNIPADNDIPIALKFERTPTSSYRSMLYINGWQYGRFNSRDGPQTLFPLPEGILNHNGKNELLLTIWSLDGTGARVADLELVTTATVSTSKEPIKGIVRSPGFAELRK
ncbi:hypothetical protein QCA50_005118 [Cerrena zonata]|uniref:beta-galactosidase n=1 Tax=Cerrena zonata TaxID=2478898 RepID=A0AAW0GDZ2_9APHY